MRLFHGPCGPEHPNVRCMADGRYSKCFPRSSKRRQSMVMMAIPHTSVPIMGLLSHTPVVKSSRTLRSWGDTGMTRHSVALAWLWDFQ